MDEGEELEIAGIHLPRQHLPSKVRAKHLNSLGQRFLYFAIFGSNPSWCSIMCGSDGSLHLCESLVTIAPHCLWRGASAVSCGVRSVLEAS